MSNFCDQAETHIFSDWLLTYCLGEGVDDLEEFYVGLPDLSEFFDRTSLPPTIHWEKIRKSWAASDLKLKRRFEKLLPGIELIDLGAGRPELSLVPRIISKLCSVQSYTAVELEHSWINSMRDPNFAELLVKSEAKDFISYLRGRPMGGRACYLLCGIEVKDELELRAESIRKELLSLLLTKTAPGDLVLFGAGTTELELPTASFRILYSDPQHFLWQKRPIWQQKIFSLFH